MPVNKFGQYLENGGSGKKDYSPIGSSKSDKKSINCQNKRLTSLSRGVAKSDAINKAQLEESIIACIAKIKTNSKNIFELHHKLEKLIKRITTPTSTPTNAATTGSKPPQLPPKRIAPSAAAAAAANVKKP